MQIINIFTASLINMMFYVIIIKKVMKINLNKNKFQLYLGLIFSSTALTIINLYNIDTSKILMTIPFITIGIKYMLDVNILTAFVYSLVGSIYIFLGEIVGMLILQIIAFDASIISSKFFGRIFGMIFVIIGTIPFLILKFPKNLLKSTAEKLNKNRFLLVGILFFIFVFIMLYKSAININNNDTILMNSLVSLSFVIIFVLFFKEQNKVLNLSNEYNVLLECLEKYEQEMDEKRKIIHDYKNQLIVINGYVSEQNKELKEYIF